MPTNFSFTDEQIVMLTTLRSELAKDGNKASPSGGVPIYSYVFKCITGMDLGPDAIAALSVQSMDPAIRSSAIWLAGAVQVNASSGAFSKVIREFNIRQGELRGKGRFSDAALQEASNAVAINLANSILDPTTLEGRVNDIYRRLPTVQEIGASDLNGVRDTLYPGNQSPGTELYLNQAWPGIVMLGALGGKYWDRLLRVDDNAPTHVDTLADLKSMLFCWDAFKTAWDRTAISDVDTRDILIGLNFPASIIPSMTTAQAAFTYMLNAQAPSPQFRAVMQAITTLGASTTLDMLMGALQGKPLIGTTTDGNFAANANAFFGPLDVTQLEAIRAQLMPTRADAIAQLAKTDVDARAALMALSVVKVQVGQEVAARMALYDLSANPGGLTATWIADRAGMLQAVATCRPGQNAVGPNNTDYVDLGTGMIVVERVNGVGAAAPARRVAFGTDQSDTVTGTDNALGDHLYGMSGDDVLAGLGGGDYLEGGAGNDALTGGAGDDDLAGGKGHDSYVFDSAWGRDRITDADGEGVLRIDGHLLEDARAAGRRSTWVAQLGGEEVILTVIDDSQSSAGSRLLISRGAQDGNTIVIEGFDLARAQGEGYLGIRLRPERALILAQGHGANPFGDVAADPAALDGHTTLPEGGGSFFTVYLNRAAVAGERLVLSAGALAGRIEVDFGRGAVAAEGAVIELMPGLTEVSFSLVQNGALDADASGVMVVRLEGGEHVATSNAWSLTLTDAPDPATTLTGDFTAVTEPSTSTLRRTDARGRSVVVAQVGEPRFVRDVTNNLVAGEGVLVTDNVLYGTGGSDHIFGGAGSDLLSGRAGHDRIEGGDGDDMIGGGAGNDTIDGGEGNDYISSAADAHAQSQQLAPRDLWSDWGPPAGATVLADGATWGVYREAGSTSRIWYGMGNTPVADQQDVVDGGAGNDMVVASWGADRVQGGAGDDELWGLAGDDMIEGGSGSDSIEGDGAPAGAGNLNHAPASRHGNDFLDGADGADRVAGGGGSDLVFGGSGDDRLLGDSDRRHGHSEFLSLEFHGEDYLDGEDGDDYLEGGGRSDTLYGGAGNDALVGDLHRERDGGAWAGDPLNAGDDYMDGEAGDDSLEGGAGTDTLFGGEGSDILWGDTPASALPPGVAAHASVWGDDSLHGEAGDDGLVGGGGSDVLQGGDGDDLLYGDESSAALPGEVNGRDELDGGDGHDTLYGGGRDDRLFGGEGDDLLRGDDLVSELDAAFHGDDELDGGAGDDTLVGEGGSDFLYGGAGDDVLQGDDSSWRLSGAAHGNDVLDGGEGADQLIGDGGSDTLLGGDGDDVLFGDNSSLASAFHGADLLDGGAGNDWLLGQGGDDMLLGGEGHDTLVAGNGNDLLDGGEGDDTYILAGGAGNKTLTDAAGTDRLVLGWSLSDLILTRGSLVLTNAATGQQVRIEGFDADDPETATPIDFIELTGDDGQPLVLSTAELIDWVGLGSQGTDGDDALGATVFTDRHAGGLGNDTYWVNGAADEVHEREGEGHDTVIASLDWRLPDHVEDLVLADGAGTGAGNERANLLLGNASPNALYGMAGDDVLDGGAGIDQLQGGAGDDTYFVDGTAEPVAGGGVPVLDLQDTAHRFGFDRAPAWRWTSDTVFEHAGDGQDRVYASASVDVEHVEEVILTSGGAVLDIDARTGAGAQRLVGNAGANRLDGGAGADTLEGGGGNDSYVADDAGDVIIERAGEGFDTLRTTLDQQALPEEVEGLVLEGHADISGAGNAAGNVLVGNAGRNTLQGHAGDDVLAGWRGDDLLQGGEGDDVYAFARGDGHDVVVDSDGRGLLHFADGIAWDDLAFRADGADLVIDVRNGDSAQSVTLRGWAGEDASQRITQLRLGDGSLRTLDASLLRREGLVLRGTPGADALTGSDLADRLDGGAGADTMAGGAGDDIYVIDRAGGAGLGDQVLEGPAGGIDTVVSSVNYVLPQHVEHLMLTGTRRLGGTGNALDNVLVGPAGGAWLEGAGGRDLLAGRDADDVLSGGADDDRLFGQGGADTLRGGAGRDALEGGAGADWLEGGTGSDYLAGGQGDDVYIGGEGRDVIALRRGGGHDRLRATRQEGACDVLSLGGGIRASDLSLRRKGVDLVPDLGAGDQLTIERWYVERGNLGVLQIVTEVPGGSARIDSYDFAALAARFERERRGTGGAPWALAPALARAELAPAAALVDPWTALQAGTSLVLQAPAVASNPLLPLESPSADALMFAALSSGGARPAWLQPQAGA